MDTFSETFEDARTAEKDGKPKEGAFYREIEEKVRPHIDLIDALRKMGVERDLALPSIAVIGDQSSGKSSVLEALSGVELPRGSGIVTRCPLQLKLRKLRGGLQWSGALSYKDEHIQFNDPSLVEGYVAEAQNKLAGVGSGISDELINLEISSPDVCDLTLIDLPGIARVPVKGQPDDIGDRIKRLILQFIEKTETIILVVVPCNVDIATTEALQMAQEVDPHGERILAILTKPDLADRGTENNILEIVQNKVIPLKKGYIIVKCRSQKQIDDKIPQSEAIQTELAFFRRHEHFSGLLTEGKVTTQCLARKLTQELVLHIKKSLPLITEHIKSLLLETSKKLDLCEKGPPLDPEQRKSFLIDTLVQFNDKVNRLSNGEVVNQGNLLILLRSEFKKWNEYLDNTTGNFHRKMQEVVQEYDLKHRSSELPGFCNYSVFERVVRELVVELKGAAVHMMNSSRDTIQEKFTDVAKTSFMIYPFLLSVSLNKIENIQSTQKTLVEDRISEQFEMEKLVYTQDGIYFKALKSRSSAIHRISLTPPTQGCSSPGLAPSTQDCSSPGLAPSTQDCSSPGLAPSNHETPARGKAGQQSSSKSSRRKAPKPSGEESSSAHPPQEGDISEVLKGMSHFLDHSVDSSAESPAKKKKKDECEVLTDHMSEYPNTLLAYYEVVTQRLADQVPMLILFFLLKESGRILCQEMLNLVDGADVNEILREESEVSRRRINLMLRLQRLTQAQRKINNFF